jgi:peptidase E
MTKYILHGGETGIPNKYNEAFYKEWVKDFKNDFIPTILLVYFSRPIEEWKNLEKQDKERFAKYTNNRLVNFIVSDIDLNIFQNQVKEADVVYIRGGSSEKLMDFLFPIKDKLLSMLDNKVYAGSSAGVMILSDFMKSTSTDWKKGFSLLPINSFVHFSEELRGDLEFFKKNHLENQNEYLLIPETEFIIRMY